MRYIDADKLSIYFDSLAEHAEMEGLHNMAHIYKRCKQLLEDTPTADVVPRAEVAREIFEEIEKIIADSRQGEYSKEFGFINRTTHNGYVLVSGLERLKKKYTEGG